MNTIDELNALIDRNESYRIADPGNPLILMKLGDIYHQASRYDESLQCYEECLQSQPNNSIAKGKIASVFISQHAFDKAEHILREIIDAGDESPEIVHNLGLSLYFQKNWEQARECFTKALNNGLQAPSNFAYLVYSLHHEGKLEEAISYCKAWVEHVGDDKSRGYLALLEFDAGNMEQAVSLAREVLETSPDDVNADIVMGTYYLEKQEVENALARFKRITQVQPENGRAWLGLGLVQLYEQNHAAAITSLDKACNIMPNSAAVRVTLGWARYTHRDLDGAEQDFRKAIKIDRSLAESHGGLATVLASKNKTDAAKEAIKVARRLDPRNFGAVYAQSILWKYAGKQEQAVKLVAKALQTPPRPGDRLLIEHLQVFLSKQASQNVPPQ